ncbi:PREDICTED: phosphatidylinositol phosphatase PTPRQ-like [Acropora digitifera]|uniref:phosphatidylinositol phosphatase PTPRQ-like n=1 Tax=Acropora digitifera TaxID=70779 RepID=UPI00077A7894|nr:PREDICTED: phosphatidylinositol phosphatase PTPRQ-like [Acropora digitifera]
MSSEEAMIKVVCVVVFLGVLGQLNARFCDDPQFTPPLQNEDPLARFTSYPNHTMQTAKKFSFQRLSVRECAQFCLQVTEERMFNCSSFEHMKATGVCLISSLSCQNSLLLNDNSRNFYHLRDFMYSNTTNPCENVSSVLPATTNVSIISHSGSGKRIDKGLISSVSVLPTASLLTDSKIRAIPSKETLTENPVRVPNITLIAPTTVHLSWSFGNARRYVTDPWGFRIVYKASNDNDTNSVLIKNNHTAVNISRLRSNTNYSFWMMTVSTNGFGVTSKVVNATTLSQGPLGVKINFTVLLSTITWNTQFENISSEAFLNLTTVIKNSIEGVQGENSTYKNITKLKFSYHSNGTVVFVSALFDAISGMDDLDSLYGTLYYRGKLQDLPVELLQENFPGKPPTNITLQAESLSSVTVKWDSPLNQCDVFQSIGFRVFYKLSNTTKIHSLDVTVSTNHLVLQNLKDFKMYVVWLRRITSGGLGPKSTAMKIRTLEKVVQVNMTVRFLTITWNTNFANPNSESFQNLREIIQQKIYFLYGQESNFIRDVQCHRFRNGSVIADMTIVYAQNVGPQQFTVVYKAIYIDGMLGNLSVKPVADNVPGKPPVNVSAESLTATSIQVKWFCVDCHQHNSTTGFVVSYKLDSSSKNYTVHVAVNRAKRFLLITALKKFAKYTIHVSSVTARGVGLKSEDVSVQTLEDVPSRAPVNLHGHNSSSTSLFVAWEPLPQDHVNGILLGYKVRYRKHGYNHTSEKNTSTNRFITLETLEKFTAYDVEVLAFTCVGDGPKANVTIFTDQDVPSLPPRDIQAHNTSSTSLMVRWNPVLQGFTHGIVLGYRVLYRREKDGNRTFSNVTTQVTFTELYNLDKFTLYFIKVLAFTIKGDGASSNQAFVRTDEDVPSLPPAKVVAYNTSSSSLLVTWLPVPVGHVHGILRGYRILFKRIGEIFYHNVTTLNQSFVLSGLEKFTSYSVEVLAFTRIGKGNSTEPVYVSTDQDVPSLPPQNVSSHNTSSTSLHISWQEVPHGFVHGILLGYRILFKIANKAEDFSIVSTSATTRYKELHGLGKFTVYEISVLAFTAIGDGPNSTIVFISTDEDIPSKPPVNLAACNTSSTSIRVTWREVPFGFLHGILRGYRVFYKKTDDNNTTYIDASIGSTERELDITGLEKFTRYSVKALAFTRKGNGPVTHNISVLTDEDVPSQPPQSVQAFNTSSTSVKILWHSVPRGLVHGILRGYRIFYSKTKEFGVPMRQAVVPAHMRHVHLVGLEKFTNYSIQVAAFTRIGVGAKSPELVVSTDEDVPSLPPQNLWANNVSSTALRVTWSPVPTGYVHGILRGYKLLYRKSSEVSAPYLEIALSPGHRFKEIDDLQKFTFYEIRILAFTIKGDGAQSPQVNVTTDEDIPSEQPRNVYAKDRTSATQIKLSWKPPPANAVHGILRGFLIWYSIIQLENHEKSPVFPRDYQEKQVPAGANDDKLTDLESYASYKIKVAAFTSKGYGPTKEIIARTCRCQARIPTSWWHNPPYVTPQPHDNRTNRNGIIPVILENMVAHCCQECHGGENAVTIVDYTTDANGLNAKKDGVIQVKDSIGTKNMISFGIAGVMSQETYHSPYGEAEYIPIMQTPGVAFIVAEKRNIHYEVLMTVYSCWPAVPIACIMAYIAGIIVWALDMKWNHVDFPKSFFWGSLEGMWWSFVTMTTVGYGDRIPKSIPARLFAFIWTWVGIATTAVIMSNITASLMNMVFQPAMMLYGTRLAAIANSTEYKLGLRRNAKLDPGRSYGNIYDIYEDLQKDRVHAALVDSYSTASESRLFSKDWLRLIEIIPVRYESANGLVLTGDAMKLARCFRDYVQAETNDIHRIIQRSVGSIEADDVPFAVKTSSELLTGESYLFNQAVIILCAALSISVLLGLFSHYCFYKRKLTGYVVTSCDSHITRSEAIEQMKKIIMDFHDSFRKKYMTLRRKHVKELLELRRLHNDSTTRLSSVPWLPRLFTNRRKKYTVTKDEDVNSIFEGMDMTIFDKRRSQRWQP